MLYFDGYVCAQQIEHDQSQTSPPRAPLPSLPAIPPPSFRVRLAQDVLRDNLERAVELLADTLINPLVTPEEVEEQKAVREHRAVF